MLPDQHADTVRAGVASPGTQKNKPHNVGSGAKHSGLVHVRQHHCHIEHAEKCGEQLLRLILRVSEHIHEHQYDQKT